MKDSGKGWRCQTLSEDCARSKLKFCKVLSWEILVMIFKRLLSETLMLLVPGKLLDCWHGPCSASLRNDHNQRTTLEFNQEHWWRGPAIADRRGLSEPETQQYMEMKSSLWSMDILPKCSKVGTQKSLPTVYFVGNQRKFATVRQLSCKSIMTQLEAC